MTTAVRVIEEDHVRILALVAGVKERIRVNARTADLRAAFHQLVECAMEHFGREEEFMRRSGYPGTAGHTREHEELVEWMRHMEQGLTQQGPNARAASRQEVVNFLQAWVERHLDVLDAPAVRHIELHHEEPVGVPAGQLR